MYTVYTEQDELEEDDDDCEDEGTE